MVMVVQLKYLLTVPLHKFVEGQVTGLATSHPLNLNFFSTWFLTLFKRKKLSSIMDGFQNRERRVNLV